MFMTSLVAQTVKHLPTVWETWVRPLGREDLLKGMATHSSILAPPPKKGGSKKYLGFPSGSEGKMSVCNAGDPGSTPGREDPWRRIWQPTLVLLPGKFHGLRSLVGYSPMGLQRIGHNYVSHLRES